MPQVFVQVSSFMNVLVQHHHRLYQIWLTYLCICMVQPLYTNVTLDSTVSVLSLWTVIIDIALDIINRAEWHEVQYMRDVSAGQHDAKTHREVLYLTSHNLANRSAVLT